MLIWTNISFFANLSLLYQTFVHPSWQYISYAFNRLFIGTGTGFQSWTSDFFLTALTRCRQLFWESAWRRNEWKTLFLSMSHIPNTRQIGGNHRDSDYVTQSECINLWRSRLGLRTSGWYGPGSLADSLRQTRVEICWPEPNSACCGFFQLVFLSSHCKCLRWSLLNSHMHCITISFSFSILNPGGVTKGEQFVLSFTKCSDNSCGKGTFSFLK